MEDKPNSEKANQSKGYIIGVTSCTNGIAHTYMSAEGLTKAAKEMGYRVKIETDGTAGAENKLTDEDIREADAVIVAADAKVDTSRFSGKRVYITGVSEGIKDPKGAIEKTLKADVFVSSSSSPSSSPASSSGDRVSVYVALMNGVSNMLPLVVAGGILIAISFFWGINSATEGDPSFNAVAALIKTIGNAAFTLFVPVMAGFIGYAIADRPGFAPAIVGGYLASTGGSGFLGALLAGFLSGYVVRLLKRLCSGMPKSLEGIKPMLIYPLVSTLIIGVVIQGIVNPLMGGLQDVITVGMNNLGTANKVMLGALIGIMLTADLGGPINKTAYLFSVAMLTAGNYEIMAACMCSGMVPSLATALAASIKPNKFTEAQVEASKANWVLGLSFICEGAIPFAASDPLKVLPSLMAGSAVAGGLSMVFGCTCPAPHGGIFVIPVIGNPLGFLISLAIGTVVGAAVLLAVKKDLAPELRAA